MSRKGCTAAPGYSRDAKIPGLLRSPFTAQGRSYTFKSNPRQPFFTLNHAAYSAGRNNRVSTVATIKPPMIATAIGP